MQKSWMKIMLGLFFMVWDKWIYDLLEELTDRTETQIDDVALEAVDEAIDILEQETINGVIEVKRRKMLLKKRDRR